MTEDEYFAELEMRICGEFDGMTDKELRSLWCDGFMPEREFLTLGDQCNISGRVWIAN